MNEQKLKTVELEQGIHNIRREYYDADIYKIISYENSRQQGIYIAQQAQDSLVAHIALLTHTLQVGRAKREECHLRTRRQSRYGKQQ